MSAHDQAAGPGDDRLIELLLERDPREAPVAAAELAALRADARVAPRIAELERTLGLAAFSARAVDPSPARADALAKRILAATTREDLSWRGDLRLLADHVKQRCRESRVTRTVAALLLANVTLGPVAAVAWVLVHEPEPERELHIRIEPREDALPVVEDDVLSPLEVDDVEAQDARDRARIENLLRRARYQLAPAHGMVPAPVDVAADAAAPLALRLLDARARFAASLDAEAWPAWLDDAAWEQGTDALTQALYAELLLDRYALHGDRAPRFHSALERLRHAAAAAPDGPARRLAEHALARARGYGVAAGSPGDPDLDPIDAAWRADLAEALAELADDPRARGWLDTGR